MNLFSPPTGLTMSRWRPYDMTSWWTSSLGWRYMQWSQQSSVDQLRRRLIQRATTHSRVTICRRSSSSDFNRPNWPNRRSCENATELWWEENIDHQAARCVSSLVLDELYDHRGTSVFLLVQVCFTTEIPMYVRSQFWWVDAVRTGVELLVLTTWKKIN